LPHKISSDKNCDLSGRIDELSLRAAIRGGKIRRESVLLTARYGK
jgi:hypothetical protein